MATHFSTYGKVSGIGRQRWTGNGVYCLRLDQTGSLDETHVVEPICKAARKFSKNKVDQENLMLMLPIDHRHKITLKCNKWLGDSTTK